MVNGFLHAPRCSWTRFAMCGIPSTVAEGKLGPGTLRDDPANVAPARWVAVFKPVPGDWGLRIRELLMAVLNPQSLALLDIGVDLGREAMDLRTMPKFLSGFRTLIAWIIQVGLGPRRLDVRRRRWPSGCRARPRTHGLRPREGLPLGSLSTGLRGRSLPEGGACRPGQGEVGSGRVRRRGAQLRPQSNVRTIFCEICVCGLLVGVGPPNVNVRTFDGGFPW